MTKTAKKIFYFYLTPRKKLLHDFKSGIEPSTFLYGLPQLQQLGFEVNFSDLAYHPLNLLRPLLQPLEQLHMRLLAYPLGFRLHQALILYPLYKNADILFCTQDSAGLPIAWLKRIGLIKNKVIIVSSNLTNAIEQTKSKWMKNFIKKNLNSIELLICSSKKEQEILSHFLGRPVEFLADGIDTKYFMPAQKTKPSIDILSVGRDPYRDYQTLFAAVRNKPWRVTVVCTPDLLNNLRVPDNVTILTDRSMQELRQLFTQAKLIVLPMKKTNKPQGHSVLLTAMAMGKKIIASNVVGITSAYNLIEFSSIALVTPKNSKRLANAISIMLSNNQSLSNLSRLRSKISVKQYASKLHGLLKKYEFCLI